MATRTTLKARLIRESIPVGVYEACAGTAKQCYSPDDIQTIIEHLKQEDIERVIAHCAKSGHLAVFNVVSVAVAVNVTRECLTQLNTHAFVKTVTQSQQYVDHRDFRYHVPEIILDDAEAYDRFVDKMECDQVEYNWLRDRLINRGFSPEEARMNARAVLPNAAEANTVLAGNLWAWFNWIQKRICKRNTPVTLDLAQQILKLFQQEWPLIFNHCGAPCQTGKCTEGKSCGKPYPRLGVN